MTQLFQIPKRLLPSWKVLSALYKSYLPNVVMEVDSFTALPEDAAELFRALEEHQQERRMAVHELTPVGHSAMFTVSKGEWK